MTTEYEEVIDRKQDELIADWQNKNYVAVIQNLSRRHPAVTAMFLVQGSQDGHLTVGDCNTITNMLTDDLMTIRDSEGIEATHRPWLHPNRRK